MSQIITWRIRGMHCASCERIIEQSFKELEGIEEIEVSLAQNRAGIRIADGCAEPNFVPLYRSLRQLGYTLEREGERKGVGSGSGHPTGSKWGVEKACAVEKENRSSLGSRVFRALIAVGTIGIIALIFSGPLQRLIPNLSTTASFGALFALGIVASLSSCLASTGGFILAYSAKSGNKKGSNVLIHAGRFAGFVGGGAILGAIGGTLPSLSGGFYGVFSLMLGIGFLVVGLNMLDLMPSLSSKGIRMPKTISRFADRIADSNKKTTPFFVGMATFLLPCGFTQTAQALALASGSLIAGAGIMLAFALGTFPVLAGVSSFGGQASLKRTKLRLAVGALLFLFAIGQIDGGLTVLGSPLTVETALASLTTNSASAAKDIPDDLDEQIAKMDVIYGTYQPKNLVVKAGIPVRWEINGVDINGCSRDIIIPSLGIKKVLRKGMNTLTFTPQKAGTIPFSCGMGMIRGSFTVIE